MSQIQEIRLQRALLAEFVRETSPETRRRVLAGLRRHVRELAGWDAFETSARAVEMLELAPDTRPAPAGKGASS